VIRVRLPIPKAQRLGLLAACWSVSLSNPMAAQEPSVTAPDVFLTGIPFNRPAA
jgi:hypothetical protein